MLDLRIIADGNALPLFDLPALLGRKKAAKEVGDQIEALIAFMDALAGDPDLEDDTEDFGAEEAGEDGTWAEAEDAHPNLLRAYSDDGGEDDGVEVRTAYRDRIRARRCRPADPREYWKSHDLDGPTPPCPFGIGA